VQGGEGLFDYHEYANTANKKRGGAFKSSNCRIFTQGQPLQHSHAPVPFFIPFFPDYPEHYYPPSNFN